jgi:hypothetical protein
VESDEGATRWRRTATEVRGEEAAASLKIRESRASFEQVFWRAEKNTRVILRPQTPLSYPSQKKTVQNDVTLIHSENPSEKKRCEFQNKATLLASECPGQFFSNWAPQPTIDGTKK